MALSKDEEEKYFLAGKIASRAVEFAREKISPGIRLLDLANEIEGKIAELGGGLAFPANLSQNNEAAHYTPSPGDGRALGERDLIKVDMGVHVDGFIADCAFSYSADPANGKLIAASLEALNAAVEKIRPGVKSGEVGEVIWEIIKSHGFVPVSNLCGHSLGSYEVHGGIEVPNVPRGNYEFREGDVFAIEPFASTGQGVVGETSVCEIYSLSGGKSRLDSSRRLQDFAAGRFNALPFARRHIPQELLSESMAHVALRDLVRCGGLHSYPVLAERAGTMVSQAETTIVIKGGRAVPTVGATLKHGL
jgi:methionyl aminopeptidase